RSTRRATSTARGCNRRRHRPTATARRAGRASPAATSPTRPASPPPGRPALLSVQSQHSHAHLDIATPLTQRRKEAEKAQRTLIFFLCEPSRLRAFASKTLTILTQSRKEAEKAQRTLLLSSSANLCVSAPLRQNISAIASIRRHRAHFCRSPRRQSGTSARWRRRQSSPTG